MKKSITAILTLMLSSVVVTGEPLESRFTTPPVQSRAYTWWHWMDGHITREGITADLEAMADSGIGGALIFSLAGPVHNCDTPRGPVTLRGAQGVTKPQDSGSNSPETSARATNSAGNLSGL